MEVKKKSFKVLLCGEASVGKTTLIQKVATTYEGVPAPTKSCTFANITPIYNGEKLSINIWDTAGQEQFRSLIKIYFRAADVVLFVVDLCERNSLETLNEWVKEAEENCGEVVPAGLLIANKMDREEVAFEIDDEMLSKEAEKYNMEYIKISALGEKNLDEVVEKIMDLCVGHAEDPNYHCISNKIQEFSNKRKFKQIVPKFSNIVPQSPNSANENNDTNDIAKSQPNNPLDVQQSPKSSDEPVDLENPMNTQPPKSGCC